VETDEALALVLMDFEMRLLKWFLAGFLLVFVGLLFVLHGYSMLPSGEAVIRCKLWRYYLLEIERATSAPAGLGPDSGSGAAALVVLGQHLAISALAGLVSGGVGFAMNRLRTSTNM